MSALSSVLILGCGDIGRRIAAQYFAQDSHIKIYGWVKSAQSAHAISQQNITPILCDLDALDVSQNFPQIPEAKVIFHCAPPPNQGENDARLAVFLTHFNLNNINTVVYLSTSGVYGDCGGAWIDETALLLPKTARAARRLAAEQAWQTTINNHNHLNINQIKLVILRVPGIYGASRLPRERLEKKLPLVRPEDSSFTNRIHQDDLANIAILAAKNGTHDQAYNVSDGNPSTMYDYHIECAKVLGLPPPPMITLEEAKTQLNPSLLSYYEESKRLLNHKIINELGVKLKYPDLISGLTSGK